MIIRPLNFCDINRPQIQRHLIQGLSFHLVDRPADRTMRLINSPFYPRRWGEKRCSACSSVVVLVITRTFGTLIDIYIPASSNVCKIIAFSGIIAGGIFFCLRTDFACFSCCICLPVLKRRKNPTKRRKNPTKRRKKSRAQNVETETAKKTGNSENLGNRR